MTSTQGLSLQSDDQYTEVGELYREQRIGGGSVGWGAKAALLIVDFQHLYTRGRASTGLEAVENTVPLLAAARANGVPVAFAVVGYEAEAVPDDHAWTMKCPGLLEARRGSEASSVDPLIAPIDCEIVHVKTVPSALFDPTVRDAFRSAGVDTIVVAGTSTSGCVRSTVVDGVSHGFRMIVAVDCVADRSKPSSDAALFDIDTKYGDLTTSAEVCAKFTQIGADA
ncbi:isochorismatase family protein [Ilumatobacter coccineus]|uniref:Putative hydrolase n=1 Tax=Ilumatobacter coccineus (strain NBRC 103263 / KCTC 29153 / YM16-304) TaxID=1313172 RepID=A0A6C7EGM0_ILUCY|nr:isochorismatase family protein [Ilumatobacter coccineus]BAN04279.1 putative hydrolase [Ilumatobacter coccineus YM16-304]